MKRQNVLFVLGILFAFARPASAVEFSVFGAGVMPAGYSVGGVDVKGKLGMGGGALLEGHFTPKLGFEAGAVYLNRKYAISTPATEVAGITIPAVEVEATSASIYVPAGIRWHLGRIISLEAGGFYDLSMESGGGSNYGVQGGLRFNIPVSSNVALLLEGRYDLGLKEENGVKLSDMFLGFVGLTFGGPGRGK